MSFLASVHARAAASPRRIVFPEHDDPRVIDAVCELARRGVVEPVLVGRPKGASDVCDVIDPAVGGLADEVTIELLQGRRGRPLTPEDAARQARNPLLVADALVKWGRADGCVAGAVYTTADVLRAAISLVGPADGVQTISSAFYMVVPPFRGGDEEVLTFTDCAVVRYPTAAQLADIALAAARDRSMIVGDIPRVAFLSFSTRGSGAGSSVDLVRAAVVPAFDRVPPGTLLVVGPPPRGHEGIFGMLEIGRAHV